jgi:ribosome-associated protein YbcJ (S4-like RNA binding protein)
VFSKAGNALAKPRARSKVGDHVKVKKHGRPFPVGEVIEVDGNEIKVKLSQLHGGKTITCTQSDVEIAGVAVKAEGKEFDNPTEWSDAEIRDYFDSHPNLQMSRLASMTGKSTKELKKILMSEGVSDKAGNTFMHGDKVKVNSESEDRNGQTGKIVVTGKESYVVEFPDKKRESFNQDELDMVKVAESTIVAESAFTLDVGKSYSAASLWDDYLGSDLGDILLRYRLEKLIYTGTSRDGSHKFLIKADNNKINNFFNDLVENDWEKTGNGEAPFERYRGKYGDPSFGWDQNTIIMLAKDR